MINRTTFRALFLTLCTVFFSASASARPLDLTTDDGVRIHADITGRGTKGVLLVHGRDRSNVVWNLFAEKLASKGFRVLSIDLRGHGKSAKHEMASDEDFASMVNDLKAGLKTLRRYQLKSISIIGADIGANLSLQLAAEDAKVDNLVLLSPGFKIKGIKATSHLTAYGKRPILLAAADGDDYPKKTVTYLKTKALGPSRLIVSRGSENGSRLLEENPGLEDTILQWVGGNYGDEAAESVDKPINIGEVDKMESTGKSFGD